MCIRDSNTLDHGQHVSSCNETVTTIRLNVAHRNGWRIETCAVVHGEVSQWLVMHLHNSRKGANVIDYGQHVSSIKDNVTSILLLKNI